LGLAQLRRQQATQDDGDRVVQALLGTGLVGHLSAPLLEGKVDTDRQATPTLPGLPVSEILIAQRRGEL
jgi:hypothetical protein